MLMYTVGGKKMAWPNYLTIRLTVKYSVSHSRSRAPGFKPDKDLCVVFLNRAIY